MNIRYEQFSIDEEGPSLFDLVVNNAFFFFPSSCLHVPISQIIPAGSIIFTYATF